MFNFSKKKLAFDEDLGDEEFDNYSDTEYMDEEEDVTPSAASPVSAPVAPSFAPTALALKIITPKAYDDAREITDFLMNGNTILLNMDGIARELAVRVLDYLKGAVQVVGGMMTRVGKTTIVIAPKNVDVSSIEAMVSGNN